MNKIRKWLIHLLGGITYEDVSVPKVRSTEQEYKTKVLEAEYTSENKSELILFEEHIKRELTMILSNSINPDFHVYDNTIVATIVIPERYCKQKEVLE